MKRTLHINISGSVFQIEEEAHIKLKEYLNSISSRLTNPEESSEIMNDIEGRIAELLRLTCKSTSDIVTLGVIDEVIKIIGNPEQIEGENSNEKKAQTGSDHFSNPIPPKRLYRDPDDRIIAGVCSGLGHYLNTSSLVIRILFVLMCFITLAPFIYLILWIVMPSADTITKRMSMTGPSYTAKNAATAAAQKTTSEMGNNLTDLFMTVGRIAAIVIGVVITLVSFLLLTSIIISVLLVPQIGITDDSAWTIIPHLPKMLIPNEYTNIATLSLLILLGIPLVALMYAGIKLIFNLKTNHKWIGITMFIIWLVSLGVLIYSGVKIGKHFMQESEVSQTNDIDNKSNNTIYLNAKPNNISEDDEILKFNHLKIIPENSSYQIFGEPEIEVIHSQKLRLTVCKSARGMDASEARRNAELIVYTWQINDSILQIDPFFTLQNNALIRDQKVNITLEIPDNMHLVIDENLRELMND